MSEGYSNAFANTFSPLMSIGAVENVTLEVVVSQLLRWVAGHKSNWLQSMEIHTYTTTMVGALNFGDDFDDVRGKEDSADYSTDFQDGAKSVPAVLLGYFTQQLYTATLHNFQVSETLNFRKVISPKPDINIGHLKVIHQRVVIRVL